MARAWTQTALDELFERLPTDRPFTSAMALHVGVPAHRVHEWVEARRLRALLRGVYAVRGLPDSLETRWAAVRTVVPADCVVTDRTAAWLHGAPMTAVPGEQDAAPLVCVFAPPGRRLRNGLTRSGERRLAAEDVVHVGGVQVTTPLRTACDLLRQGHRDQALGVTDMLAGCAGLSARRIEAELGRFKRYRGIVQARALAPVVDGRSGSPSESVMRLRWHDAGLPRPECQVEVESPVGSYYIDVGLPGERFGAEYFGAEFHHESTAHHDETRLAWIRDVLGWTLPVLRRVNVHGRQQDAEFVLRAAWRDHRARHARTIV
ncbi:hypothetical protein [Nocardioides sp. R-C-SC26]|uniref:hypothetical protein n=1 Tax=Nocardioides sp. R-C-SC26 TaxID=2870414 RepID=UPI001E58F095|nr:hypothetical protein [Nocardioides sp. R-C-SC26]